MNFPHLFTSGNIGRCHLKNRIMMPLYPTKYAREGKINPKMVEFYRARARGGVSLIVLDCPCLDYPRAYKGSHQLRIDSAEYVAGLKELLDAVKSEGARAFMQLNYPWERTFKQQVPGAQQKGAMWIAPLTTTMSIAEADEILEIMARAPVADPDFPRKAESYTQDEEIRPCVACLEDCAGKGVEGIGRCCTVNPFAGHEFVWKITPSRKKKKVLVIGGGPGGAQAALVASQKGHAVELWEQSEQIGGQIQLAHLAPFKQEMAGILTYLINCLNKSPVKIRTGQPTDRSKIAAFKPDVVIIATGSRPGLPPVPGIDADFVVQARDLYLTGPPAGDRIVIIGGGDIGCETADWLAGPNKQISVVDIAPAVLARMKNIPKERLLKRLSEKGVRLYEETRVISIEEKKVRLKSKDESEFTLEADLVVIGINAQSEDSLIASLRGSVKEVIAVGDAAFPGNLGAALRNATEVALKI